MAKWIRKSIGKSQKAVNFTRIQLTCDQLVSTCVGWPNGENLRRLAYEFELDQSKRKSSQVHASGWPNETQVERKSKTCVDLRVRLASGFSFSVRVSFRFCLSGVFLWAKRSLAHFSGRTVRFLFLPSSFCLPLPSHSMHLYLKQSLHPHRRGALFVTDHPVNYSCHLHCHCCWMQQEEGCSGPR